MDSRAIFESIDHIHEAGLNPQHWPAALEAINKLIPETALSLLGQRIAIEDKKTGEIRLAEALTTNMPPDAVEKYLTYYAPKNVWLPLILDAKTGRALTGGPWQTYRGREFFEDWALPNHLECVAGVKLSHTDHGVVVFSANYANRYQERIEARCLRLSQIIAPHLQRAIKTNQLLSRLEQCERSFERLIEQIASPAIIVDAKLRVAHLNLSAKQALNTRRGIYLSSAGLRFVSGKSNAALREEAALWRRDARLAASRPPMPIIFDVADEPGPNLAWVLPLARAQEAATHPFLTVLSRESGLAMILLKYRRDAQCDPGVAVAAAFALTDAETRLVRGLVCGRNVKEYADFEGIAENTARWHLKNILFKTNCRNQSELIRLFSVFSWPIS